MPHNPNNKLHKLIIDRGYVMRDLSLKIGFSNQTSLRNVLIKREFDGRVNKMGVDKWIELGKVLNIGLTELMELYNTEVK